MHDFIWNILPPLGKTYIFSAYFLYILTLPKSSKMWYVMHGVLWAYCAHGAHRFSVIGKRNVFLVIRSVSAGGHSQILQEAAGVTPVGDSPTNPKNE